MALDYGVLAGQLIGAGSTILGAASTTKANQIAASTADKNNKTALELAKINQDTERLKLQGAGTPVSAKSNTVLYIALGVGGVLVLGLTIFAVTRK